MILVNRISISATNSAGKQLTILLGKNAKDKEYYDTQTALENFFGFS